MEYLAREIAAIRIALEQKADREDLVAPIERLSGALEALEPANRLQGEDDLSE